jgi:hypothetical protein
MNFVIFFDGQEGSTAIIQNLINFDQIGILHGKINDLYAYEPFEDYMFLNSLYGGLGRDMPIDEAMRCMGFLFNRKEDFFRQKYASYSSFNFSKEIFSKQFLGFKMTTNRYPQEELIKLIEYLRHLEVVVFFLERKDNLKWAISKSMGHLKQFELVSGKPRGDFRADIDKIKGFLEKCKHIKYQKKIMFDEALKSGIDCEKIFYEDFMYGKNLFFERLTKKLGLNSKLKSNKHISLKKVHPDDLKLLLNYSEANQELAHEVKKSEEVKNRYGSVRRRIKVLDRANWPHLRSGWPVASKLILDLHNPNGVLFCDYLDGFFGSGFSMEQPWIGFFHNTPENHSSTGALYNFHDDRGLKALINKECFKKSLPKCMGLLTLSEYIRDFLNSSIPNITIDSLLLPTEEVERKFDFGDFASDPSVVTVGHWQRLYENLNKLKGVKKKFLKWSDNVNPDWIYEKHGLKRSQDIQIVEKLDNQEYDIFLSKNVVFLQLFDAAANNIVVECIIRNNPIIVNRLPSLYEYLGEDYPLYYENFEHAQQLVADFKKIEEGHLYLKKKDKYMLSPNYFVSSFEQSNVYQSLPFFKL